MVNIKQQQNIELIIDAELRCQKENDTFLMTKGKAHIADWTLCTSGSTGFI